MRVGKRPDEEFPGFVTVAQAVVVAALEKPRTPRRQKFQHLLPDIFHRAAVRAPEIPLNVRQHLGVRSLQSRSDGLAQLGRVEGRGRREILDIDLDLEVCPRLGVDRVLNPGPLT